jgi:hypothetical protein
MVDTLLEEVVFLEVGRVRKIAMPGWRDTAVWGFCWRPELSESTPEEGKKTHLQIASQ